MYIYIYILLFYCYYYTYIFTYTGRLGLRDSDGEREGERCESCAKLSDNFLQKQIVRSIVCSLLTSRGSWFLWDVWGSYRLT